MERDKIETILGGVRKEMMDALNTFLFHVRYTITLMSTMFAAGVTLVSYALEHKHSVLQATGILVLLFIPFVAESSASIVRRYYKIYVSNYIYSARLHLEFGIVSHPWVSDLEKKQNISNVADDEAVEAFIEGKRSLEKHSWYYYKRFLQAFGIAGVVAGVVSIVVCANA